MLASLQSGAYKILPSEPIGGVSEINMRSYRYIYVTYKDLCDVCDVLEMLYKLLILYIF